MGGSPRLCWNFQGLELWHLVTVVEHYHGTQAQGRHIQQTFYLGVLLGDRIIYTLKLNSPNWYRRSNLFKTKLPGTVCGNTRGFSSGSSTPPYWVPSFTLREVSVPVGRLVEKGLSSVRKGLTWVLSHIPRGHQWESRDCTGEGALWAWAISPAFQVSGAPLVLSLGRRKFSLTENLLPNWPACLPLRHSSEAAGKLFLGSKKQADGVHQVDHWKWLLQISSLRILGD